MRRIKTLGLIGALIACLSSSNVTAADSPEYSGFLGDSSQLQSRPDSQLIYNYVYEKPGADFTACNRFLIEAVTVFPSKDADFKGINANDLALLQKYFRDALVKALTESNGDQVVNPVANLISVPIQSNWDFGIGAADAMRYTLNVQPVIPISLNPKWNLITRTIMPIVHAESPIEGGRDKSGLGDILQSFFFSNEKHETEPR